MGCAEEKWQVQNNSNEGSTWHHHPVVGGNLQLVSHEDHKNRHGDYHPKGRNGKRVGGRKTWGGGSSCRK
ncbi:hypothetical protein PspCFBP13528_01100 [Pseudomonas sp. CFBP13528]|nr:HNH endonuclease [Pseudomonas sp. CFBP13528]TKK35881.1 hypothetical protein PspCFBP13528_01100 [Pseudomonas sp. CFBP13528]